MILIGQYDSPFVRRAGIALTLYGLDFTHYPWSTFSDFDRIQPYNPLVRVPVLVLDNGEVLTETLTILDYLDSLMPIERRLLPVAEPARHLVLRVVALAGGVADKAVSLFYELKMHRQASEIWVRRCKSQMNATLSVLDAERARQIEPYWFGNRISHADIAIAATLRFVLEAHPDLLDMTAFPALDGHARCLEALPAFRAVRQTFLPPT